MATTRAQTLPRTAHAILGPRLYSFEDSLQLLGLHDHPSLLTTLRFSRTVSSVFDIIPYSLQQLRHQQASHLLVPSLPLSLVELHKLAPDLFTYPAFNSPWYRQHRFATTPLASGWLYIRLGPLEDTDGLSRQAQLRRLTGAGLRVPTAPEVLLASTLYYRRHGSLVPSHGQLRVSGASNEGHGLKVALTSSPGHRLHVFTDRDNAAEQHTGLATTY